MSYYNTTNESDETLRDAMLKAKTQDERVLKLFETYEKMSPYTCHRFYESVYPPVPITSIRRAISNLTKAGKLEKTEVKQPGKYGAKNYVWRVL